MSHSLFARPHPTELPPATCLDSDLKHAIAERFWDHDGSLTGGPRTLRDSPGDLGYLRGLVDGRVDGAATLLDLVMEHGAVDVWIGSEEDR